MKSGNNFIVDESFFRAFGFQDIEIHHCEYKREKYTDDLFDYFDIFFPIDLENASDKRKAEFLAGRYSAKEALDKLNVKSGKLAIGKHRRPDWPDSVVASITHTDSIAMCAAAYSDRIAYLGIDLEQWINIALCEKIKNIIIDKREEMIIDGCGLSFANAYTLIFSAKESLFKALSSSVGEYFGFEAARVVEIDMGRRRLRMELNTTLSSKFKAGFHLDCHFRMDKRHVITLIYGN